MRLTTLPPSCAVIMKSGNLNLLVPSGPLQACIGTALPLPFTDTKTHRTVTSLLFHGREKHCLKDFRDQGVEEVKWA